MVWSSFRPVVARRWVTAVVVALAVCLASYAVASAALSAVSDDLGSGGRVVAACDTDGFVIDGFTLNGSGEITHVAISGINPSCAPGGVLSVSLTRADDVSIGSGGPIAVVSPAMSVPIDPPFPSAALVKHEVIIIVGP